MAEGEPVAGPRGESAEREHEMTKASRLRKVLWLEHVLWVVGTGTLLAIALAAIAGYSGLANPLLRRALISRMETLTGGKVEVRNVSIGWFCLDAKVRGLVLHGKETS